MLIDTLSIQYSGNVAKVDVLAPLQLNFIEDWKTLLTSVGWNQIAALHATASVTFPLGCPITDGVVVMPHGVAPCATFPGFMAIGSQSFTFYDPYKTDPDPFGTCIFVAEGLTYADSFDNLVLAINTFTPWFAVVVANSTVSFTINLTAVAAGPAFNFVEIRVSGFGSGGDRSSGGGYQLESGHHGGSAIYQCAVTNANSGGAEINYLYGNILFTFTLNGSNASYQLLDATQGTQGFLGSLGVGAVAQYTIIANPYGFAVFDAPRDATTQQYRTISLFAMAPYFPTITSVPPSENFVPAYGVFLIGPNQIGGAPSWNNALMLPSTMCLDGTPFQTYGFNPSARLLCYRQPGFALPGPHGLPFHYGAYVQFGAATGNSSPAWVVGKLWDVAIVTDFVSDNATIDGREFITMGYSDGSNHYTVCSVMMAAETPDAAGPVLSGTVNLFGNGVTWLSGDLFVSGMVGNPITIGGTAYIVASVTDSKHIVLTTAITILSGAAYSAPDPSDPPPAESGGQSPFCIASPGSSGGAAAFSNSGH